MYHFTTIVNGSQHGFRSRKSINTYLMELITFSNDVFLDKCQVNILYTDFTKALIKYIMQFWLKKCLNWNLTLKSLNGLRFENDECETTVPASSLLSLLTQIYLRILVMNIVPLSTTLFKFAFFANRIEVFVMKIFIYF